MSLSTGPTGLLSRDSTGLSAAHQVEKGSLGRLPPEVLKEVLQLLTPGDIKTVRLLNKSYRDSSSPYLISRVFIAARRRVLEAFEEIVNHPVFSKTVTEIVYDVSAFPKRNYREIANVTSETVTTESEEESDEEVYEGTDIESDEDDDYDGDWLKDWREAHDDSPEKTQALNEYRVLLAEQRDTIDQNVDLKCLERAGQLLPKVRSIRYSDWKHTHCWYVAYEEQLLQDMPLPILPCNNWSPPQMFSVPAAIAVRPLSSVLESLLSGKAIISKVEIAIGCRPENEILSVVKKADKAKLTIDGSCVWTRLMANLTSLDLFFGLTNADNKTGNTNPLKVYARLIAQATNLRTLRVFIKGSVWWQMGPHYRLESVKAVRQIFLSQISLPRLENLSLEGGFYIQPRDLYQLLDRHAATLHSLHLVETCLLGAQATWPDIFDHLRNTLTSLKCIKLNYLYQHDEATELLRAWSLACPRQRLHLDTACRWMLGNGEATNEEREAFEDVRENWDSLAKSGNDVPKLDSYDAEAHRFRMGRCG